MGILNTEKAVWGLTEGIFEEYKQGKTKDECLGTVRIGMLSYDILGYGDHIDMNLYVGNVLSGYADNGFCGIEGIPYDKCDSGYVRIDKDVTGMSFEEFKASLLEAAEEKIKVCPEYEVRDFNINLIEKAGEDINEQVKDEEEIDR